MHSWGATRFCRNFLSHRTETKKFVKEPFCFAENFWYRKKFMDKRGISQFSAEIFMSHSAENFREGIILFLRKFLVSKSFMDEKGGGVSRFSVENFWSHSAEKLLAPAYFSPNYKCFDQLLRTVKNKRIVLILVFTKINSTFNFCTLCKRVSRFSVEKFSSHSAEKFRRGTLLYFRKILVSKNVRDKRGAGITIFCQNCFVSQYRNISFVERNPSMFQKVSGIEKFYAYGGILRFL